MSVENILRQLQQVRRTNKDQWLACCPAHDDKNPSLAIRHLQDGRVLMHCFSGCDVNNIVNALGLEMDSLFPKKNSRISSSERNPFPANQALKALAFESLIVLIAGKAIQTGYPLPEEDFSRLLLAVARIQDGLQASGVKHHG